MTIVQRPRKRPSPARVVSVLASALVTAVVVFVASRPLPALDEDGQETLPTREEPRVELPPWAENVPPADAELEGEGCQVSVQATYVGRPADDVRLSLHLVGAHRTESTWDAVPRADGVHRFFALPKGTYHLVALREGTPPTAAPVWRCDEGHERAFFQLDLAPGGAPLRGRVTGRGGVLAPGTEVMLEQPDGHRAAFPGIVHLPLDEEGRFEVMLRPGRYTLLALAPHHTPRVQELHVDENGGSTHVRLAWRPEVRGTVFDDQGQPVAGARVFLGGTFDPKVGQSVVETEPDGTFALPVLPGREVVISARADAGFGMARLPEVRAIEGHTDVVVQLQRGRVVGGFIEHRDGRPCAFCEVSYRARTHGLSGVVKADEEGKFAVAGMPLDADVELWPKDGATGAWAGQVATPQHGRVLLTYVPPAY